MGLLDAETLTPELGKKNPEGRCGPQWLAGIQFGNTTRVAETLASGASGPMLLYGMASNGQFQETERATPQYARGQPAGDNQGGGILI